MSLLAYELICKLCGNSVDRLIYGKCRPCTTAYHKEWKRKNPDKVRASYHVRGVGKWENLIDEQKRRKQIVARKTCGSRLRSRQ